MIWELPKFTDATPEIAPIIRLKCMLILCENFRYFLAWEG